MSATFCPPTASLNRCAITVEMAVMILRKLSAAIPRGGIIALAAASAACATSGAASPEVRDSVLVIPAATKRIADRAFADRTDFNRVEFASPCVLSEIGEHAFLGCVNLRDIPLPSSLRKIGEGAFRECVSLTEISLPRGVTAIPRQAFAWCEDLREVSIPETVTDIASHSFAYCASLGSIEFPRRVTHIGSNAFSFCGSLTEISLPATVRELESYAFSECVSLRSATLPANSHLLGELIFSGCRSLESVTTASPVPAEFDCASTLFEENERGMYETCRLYVPARSVEAYRRAGGWSLFSDILPIQNR